MLLHEMCKILLCMVTFFPIGGCYFQRPFSEQNAFEFH
jgi:hypothetical protein